MHLLTLLYLSSLLIQLSNLLSNTPFFISIALPGCLLNHLLLVSYINFSSLHNQLFMCSTAAAAENLQVSSCSVELMKCLNMGTMKCVGFMWAWHLDLWLAFRPVFTSRFELSVFGLHEVRIRGCSTEVLLDIICFLEVLCCGLVSFSSFLDSSST